MIQEYTYISIKEVLSRVKRHPLLEGISFEKAVQYALDFFRMTGLPRMFADKVESVDIEEYKGLLPCDIVQINQVRDHRTKACMRSMTGNFQPGDRRRGYGRTELAFKTQGNIIFTTFRRGSVDISYKSLPVDGDGYPMVLDNPVFLRALEEFIKKEEFEVFFDMGQIPANTLENAKQRYAWAVAELGSELTLPSVSEMETMTRMWNTLLQRTTDFDSGFSHLGDREIWKVKP